MKQEKIEEVALKNLYGVPHTLYQKTKTGKIQQWKIWVEPKGESKHPEVWIEHGQTDGKKQTTFDVVESGVNLGKANETTPLEQAYLEMERKITKQKEHGYVYDISKTEEKKTIDFDSPFPKELCFYKPKNSVEDTKIAELEKNKKAIYTVKRDGMMHIIRVSKKFGAEIYTRTMDLASDKFPHLQEAFGALPNGTVILGEIILDKDGKDNFSAVSSICRSDALEAEIKQGTLGKVSYYAFDLAFYKSENLLTSMGYKKRLEELDKLIKWLNNPFIKSVEVIDKPHKQALKEVIKRGLEGLVVWDADGTMEDDRCFTFNGKANRPNVLWKSKPKYEDDFIVKWDPDNDIGKYGTGKNHGKVKSVALYQIDESGNEVCLGNCGGGLSEKQRDFYTNKSLFPRVWRVEYDSIQNKTGALRFPVFNADRTLTGDKTIKECLMSDAIKQAREQEEDEDE